MPVSRKRKRAGKKVVRQAVEMPVRDKKLVLEYFMPRN